MWLWLQVFITESEIILQCTAEVGGGAQYQVSHQAVNINWNSLCSEFKHIVMFSSAVVFRLSSWSLFHNINISFLLPGIWFEMRTLLYWIITQWDWFLINNVFCAKRWQTREIETNIANYRWQSKTWLSIYNVWELLEWKVTLASALVCFDWRKHKYSFCFHSSGDHMINE